MYHVSHYRGYLLFQCAIALFCVGVGLSVLLKTHIQSLQTQKTVHAQSWALIHASNARHIQQKISTSAQHAWQAQVDATLSEPKTHIVWNPHGQIAICWYGGECWRSE